MPNCFKALYPKTHVVIECTELFFEKASAVRSQSVTFSHYKHYNNMGLVGISPAGGISFASDLYAGRTSEASVDCWVLSFLETGDSIMADKGFELENVLPKYVSLNIPPFPLGTFDN